jgi:copper chaperone CopZ
MVKLKITGMSCGGCVSSVESALKAVVGVNEVLVDLQSGMAEVDMGDSTVTPDQLVMAVKMAGFDARPVA